ncbi:MAG: hypothetical protein ACREDY_23720 [Bradyrhizobium sp.]
MLYPAELPAPFSFEIIEVGCRRRTPSTQFFCIFAKLQQDQVTRNLSVAPAIVPAYRRKECVMKRHYLRATAAAMWVAAVSPAVFAAGPSTTTDPGFVPQTGQINPGQAPAPWSATASLPQDQQPAQEDARAALMMPDPVGVSSLGGAPQGQNGDAQTTSGAAPATGIASSGPIGATLQTMPAKYSQRNDLLDHLPVMAWPLPLNEQQRHQIYQAIMAQKASPTDGLSHLKPASALSYQQARDMRPLPGNVASIDGLRGLKYVRDKDRVLLIQPSTGIVVDQITM